MTTPKPNEFMETLEENERTMGEYAAFSVTCEMYGISEEEGYDLMADAATSDDDE